MKVTWRLIPIALCALLLGAMGNPPVATPLPSACDTLRALPAEVLGGQSLDFKTTQDRKGDDIVMSMCSALGEDGLPVITLLLRQDVSATEPQTALAQRETMLAELAETFGQDPEARFPDIGDAAMWVPDIKQLTVWSQKERAMFILTGMDASQDRTEQIAREIVARFP